MSIPLISSSLNVVSDAQVFCESFSLWAILCLILFIFTRRSPRLGPAETSSAAGVGFEQNIIIVASDISYREIGSFSG